VSQDSPTVAIVDDEEPVRRALQRLMVSAGITVESFASGAEFLDSLATRRPDCLVLDLHMPGLNGFDVQARLRQSRDPPPVVVITGHDTAESKRRVIDGGAAAYLRKPVDDQVLLDAVAAAVSGKRTGP
jgi:FixJ family two-component response regulator